MQHVLEYRRLRAPEQDGGTLIEPPWPLLPEVVAANRALLQGSSVEIQGRSLRELAHSARQSLLEGARWHTSQYCTTPRLDRATSEDMPSILMAGHQPQLFHPGVWYKNFALAKFANHVGAVAINLLIDSDVCRCASVRAPAGPVDDLQIAEVPFDQTGPKMPFEERPVLDPSTFDGFGERLAASIRPLIEDPLVHTFWPVVRAGHAEEPNLGRCLARGRHQIEIEWSSAEGQHPSMELPQSAVCQLDEFHWFTAHLLANLTKFISVHNEALAAYRRDHRLRSRTHPVPDLATDGDWQEAPFWVWSREDPVRRPLFARQLAGETIISDRSALTQRLRLSESSEASRAVDQLGALRSRGVKIRTRALTTTLFARLLLSDLFVHGIGGAKYDEVTDQILRDFYTIQPPQYGVVSATLRLPVRPPRAPQENYRKTMRELRDLKFNPERYIDQSETLPSEVSKLDAIVAEKLKWVSERKVPETAKRRHDAIVAANEALQPFISGRRVRLRTKLSQLAEAERIRSILHIREWPFCIFAEPTLRNLLLDSHATTT